MGRRIPEHIEKYVDGVVSRHPGLRGLRDRLLACRTKGQAKRLVRKWLAR